MWYMWLKTNVMFVDEIMLQISYKALDQLYLKLLKCYQ
jgi:hypothetical protein